MRYNPVSKLFNELKWYSPLLLKYFLVVQGCSVPGNTQGQVGRGSEQPDLVEDVPAPCGEVRLDDL